MDTDAMRPAELADWEVLKSFLPDGWQAQAKALGAFQRSRKVKDAEALLRLLLIHVAGDCSLRMTALRAEQAGLCDLSDVAVVLRARPSAGWVGGGVWGAWEPPLALVMVTFGWAGTRATVTVTEAFAEPPSKVTSRSPCLPRSASRTVALRGIGFRERPRAVRRRLTSTTGSAGAE